MNRRVSHNKKARYVIGYFIMALFPGPPISSAPEDTIPKIYSLRYVVDFHSCRLCGFVEK